MTSNRMALAALVSFLGAVAAGPSLAGDGWGASSRGLGHHRHYGTARPLGYTSPVMRVPRTGTFSRSVWVMNRGHLRSRPPVLLPKATILHVGSPSATYGFPDPCSYESGVCVIRMND